MSLVSAIQCIRLFIAARYFLLILPVLQLMNFLLHTLQTYQNNTLSQE